MQEFSRIRELLQSRQAGHSLPQALYTSAEAFDFDMRAIFGRAWVIVGLECELPRPGAALALTVGGSPIVVLRDRDGEIGGFITRAGIAVRWCVRPGGASGRCWCARITNGRMI